MIYILVIVHPSFTPDIDSAEFIIHSVNNGRLRVNM